MEHLLTPDTTYLISGLKRVLRRKIDGAISMLAVMFARLCGLTRASHWSTKVLQASSGVTWRESDEHEYIFSATSPLLLWRAHTLLTKEPETLDWIRTFRTDDVFYDIGANVGTYTIYAARRCGRVYAFEPESGNYAVLNRNIRLNALGDRVRAFPFAIAEARRLDSLRLHSTDPGAALHVFGRDTDFKLDRFAPAFEQGALALPLDEIVFGLGLPPPTQIKIDVDGLESQVLRGAAQVLAQPAVRGLLLEINERQDADMAMVGQLANLGFRVAHKGEPVIDTTGRARMVNYVFARD